jgi:monoterpene epsilon-lactone hydrolase
MGAELQALVTRLKSAFGPANPTVEELRMGWEKLAASLPIADDVQFESDDLAGVAVEWTSLPNSRTGPFLLYFHGGGYNIGSVTSYRQFVGRLSRACGYKVLSVEYRLAPENRFPAAVEDAATAYRILLARGHLPENIIIAGDSAGGGLALALMLALKEKDIEQPRAAILFSPSTDLAKTGGMIVTHRDRDPVIRIDTTNAHALRYLGPEGNPDHPLASPLYGEHSGLPPLLILVGTEEMLLDDSRRVAERAKNVGVEVTLEIWDGMFHVWPFFAAILLEGQSAIDRVGQYVRERFARG